MPMESASILIICPTARTAEHYRRVRIDASETFEEAGRWRRARVIATSQGIMAIRGYRDVEPWFIDVPDGWHAYQSLSEASAYFERIGIPTNHDDLDNWRRR